MKKLIPVFSLLILAIFLYSCKCRFVYNTTIVGYDMTECACCGGYKVSIRTYDVQAKKYTQKEYIVKTLTGDLGKTITPTSKFPISGQSLNYIYNKSCTSTLDTIQLYQPFQECPK